MSNLSCQELVELVSAYLEDAMPDAERARFDQHLSICPGCVTYVDQIRETIRLTGEQLREETLTGEMRATLLAEFADWKTTRDIA